MGKVTLDGADVELKFGNFPRIREGSVLAAEDGRAEVLLSPGVFLRIGENSAIKMVSDRLTDTRLQLLQGSAVVECGELSKGDSVTIAQKAATITIAKEGLYRVDNEPPLVKVYDGEADVDQGGQVQTVHKGRMLLLNGVSVAEKFDTRTGDPLFRWARRRAEYLAMANVSAAKYAYDQGLQGLSRWMWNPYFGMYTFLPYRGIYRSYWGYNFWSPGAVYVVYRPPSTGGGGFGGIGTYNPSVGYSQVGSTSAGTSGTVAASAPPTAASSAASAPVARETGSAGGRSR
jgi:hypothetical protein